ncbi:MAG: glycosyltransferase [Microcoleaceae cyanobacterium]
MNELLNQTEPQVTVIVVPRERFSCAQESLDSIYEHTKIPFKLIYVDGNSPKHIQSYLQNKAETESFKIIRTDYYLSPNQARNIGLAEVDTKYLAFVDNDVVVTSGWLTQLIQCAEETDAAVVGPLMCQERPLHEIVHCAGGDSHIWVDKTGRRRFREKMCLQGKKVSEVRDRLQRQETELAEFHCVLIRRSIFDKIGVLDEAMLNTKEHLDLCMLVRQAGEKVYFEPNCIVTYVPGPPLERSDLHYYMLRWSDAWQLASLHRLRDKWNLAEDGYFKAKYKKIGWRRYGTVIIPLVSRLTRGVGNDLLARIIGKIDHVIINRFLTTRHANQQRKINQSTPS